MQRRGATSLSHVLLDMDTQLFSADSWVLHRAARHDWEHGFYGLSGWLGLQLLT
jgi:hypothetical protein